MRPFASALVGSLLTLTAPIALAADPKPGGAINIATVGEPPTLDPMESPADVVGIISQHMFETLYTWGDGWKVVPLLAASDAEISADGKTYTIPLRTGRQVPRRHGHDLGGRQGVARAVDARGAARQAGGGEGRERRGARRRHDPDRAEGAVRAVAAAAVPADQRRHHAAGREAGAAHDRVRRHRPLPVQGAPARPVRPARPLRRLRAARRRRQHVWRAAGGLPRRDALRAGAERQHTDRGRAQRPLSLCRRAAGRIAAAPRGPGAGRADRAQAVRLAVDVLQRQGGHPHRSGAAACGGGEPQLRGHAGGSIRQHRLL